VRLKEEDGHGRRSSWLVLSFTRPGQQASKAFLFLDKTHAPTLTQQNTQRTGTDQDDTLASWAAALEALPESPSLDHQRFQAPPTLDTTS